MIHVPTFYRFLQVEDKNMDRINRCNLYKCVESCRIQGQGLMSLYGNDLPCIAAVYSINLTQVRPCR